MSNPYHDAKGEFTTAAGGLRADSTPKIGIDKHLLPAFRSAHELPGPIKPHGTKKFRRDHAEMDRLANAQMRKALLPAFRSAHELPGPIKPKR